MQYNEAQGGIQYIDKSLHDPPFIPIPSPPSRPRRSPRRRPAKPSHSQRCPPSRIDGLLVPSPRVLGSLLVVPVGRCVSAQPFLLLVHQVLRLAHALLSEAAHAHRVGLALVVRGRTGVVRRVHLRRRARAGGAEALLLSVALLLRGHVGRFAAAAVGHFALVVDAALVHHALLLHAALFVQALVFAHAALVLHSAPVVLACLLSLLLSLMVRCEGLLFMPKRIFAAHGTLMHRTERATNGCVVCMVRMVLGLAGRCLRKGRRRWRVGDRLEWLGRWSADLVRSLRLVWQVTTLFARRLG